MDLFIKRFFTFIITGYVFGRILNIKNLNIKFKLMFIGFSLLMTIGYFLIKLFPDLNNDYVHTSYKLFGFAATVFVFQFIHKLNFFKTLTVAMVSYALTNVLYFVAGFLMSVVCGVLQIEITDASVLVGTIIMVLVQSVFAFLLFRIRRYKHGFQFLQDGKYPYMCILLSLLIIVLSHFLLFDYIKDGFFLLLVLFPILASALILNIVIQREIKKTYIKRQRKRELDYLYTTIENYKKEIQKLGEDNEELARIIHKDNKLIPALKDAVMTIIKKEDPSPIEAQKIYDSLDKLLSDRELSIDNYSKKEDDIPKTGIILVDAMMEYMSRKSKAEGISFSVQTDNDFDFSFSGINGNDLCTIIADLIENAFIAVRESELKIVKLRLSYTEGFPTVTVSDSGMDFNPEVIRSFGLKRRTTHANTGGSGIGLMQLFSIKNKYKATLNLCEYDPTQNEITKSISVIFDNNNRFYLYSARCEMLKRDYYRYDIIYENTA